MESGDVYTFGDNSKGQVTIANTGEMKFAFQSFISDLFFQLGFPIESTYSSFPILVASLSGRVQRIASGSSHLMALTYQGIHDPISKLPCYLLIPFLFKGILYSWGSAKEGKLGISTLTASFLSVPTEIKSLSTKSITTMACGNR